MSSKTRHLFLPDASLSVHFGHIFAQRFHRRVATLPVRNSDFPVIQFPAWKQIPIITIDDDVIYDDDLVQSLYDSYKEFPNCVSARRVHRMTYSSNNKLLPYRQWIYEDKSIYKTPSKQLFATGCGGILYPENCLNISTNDLTQIKLALNADDIFLKKKEQVLDILVVHAKGKRDIPYIQQKSSNASYALCFMNNTRYRCDNDMYIKILDLK